MLAVSPRFGEFLIKTTSARDVDDALHKVFADYLELKLKSLNEITADFKKKWGMSFNEFKDKLKGGGLEKGGYSYDVEKDFWKWEEAETLKRHYEEMSDKWI